MQLTTDLLTNLLHPPILAFILGMLAVACKSDLEVPPQIAKFLGLYLLFHIGIKGGEELFHSGFTFESIRIIGVCTLVSFITPWLFNKILKLRLNIYDAGAIAASYGSISAINFIASSSILDASNIPYSGYMVACMAFMESPAVIAGLIIIGLAKHSTDSTQDKPKLKMKNVLHEALFNGSVFLLIGSMLIGFLSGHNGEVELKSFVDFLLSLGKIENCQSNKWTITAANFKFLNDDFNANTIKDTKKAKNDINIKQIVQRIN